MKLTIPAAVDRAASLFGDQLAIAEPAGPRLSYAQLRDRVRAVVATDARSDPAPGSE